MRLHGETPDHAECVKRGQLVNVAAAENDGEYLQAYDQIDNAVTRAVAMVGTLEPTGEDTVFGHAVEHAVGPDNGSILRTRQN